MGCYILSLTTHDAETRQLNKDRANIVRLQENIDPDQNILDEIRNCEPNLSSPEKKSKKKREGKRERGLEIQTQQKVHLFTAKAVCCKISPFVGILSN